MCVCVGWAGAPLFWRFLDHALLDTDTSPLRLFWTSDQVFTETATYWTHNKHKRRKYMLSAWFKHAIPAIKWLHLKTARPLGSVEEPVGMIKVVIYEFIKLGKETMDVIRLICWTALICTAVNISRCLYFWSNWFYYSGYSCVLLCRSAVTLCCEKFRHNFLSRQQ